MSFNDLGLMAQLVRAVGDQGYSSTTPVQAQSIPAILGGSDVMAAASTGTGKTAGFTLPLLQRLMEQPPAGNGRPVRALILAPTRELAAQVQESVNTYGRHLPLKSTAIFGGVGMRPQIQTLRRGVDILVATPGRLLDHMRQRTVDLSQVEILVLDEADRMLDMGFLPDIKKLIAAVSSTRQTLMFSATFSGEIRKLAAGMLRDPVQIQVAAENSATESVVQTIHPVGRSNKRALLSTLIRDGDWKQVLVFTRTKHGADRLAGQLEQDGVTAVAIHGNKSQGARTRALGGFKRGRVRVLVATDIAARGLDIEQLPHVVNYELPNTAEDYVHRIGRTGRAGHGGKALSLVCADERKQLRDIERLLRREINREVIPGFEPDPNEKPRPVAGKPGGRGNGPRRPGGGKPGGGRPGGGRPGNPAQRRARPQGRRAGAPSGNR